MLNDTLFRIPRSIGLQPLQLRGQHGAQELSSWRLRLAGGGSLTHAIPGEESVLILQNGRGTLAAGGQVWPVSRTSVFDERATALYLPAGTEFTVTAHDGDGELEAILISTPAPSGGEPVLARPDDVQAVVRGKATFTRHVHDIFVRDPHAKRLMVGETFNPAGNWSSFPPHKHDGRNQEPRLEEVYHYRVDPAPGFGLQMMYTNDGEQVVHHVVDGDTVLLPYGYHPVTSPPGYQLYYLWAMAGDERKLALYEDPAHAWISGAY